MNGKNNFSFRNGVSHFPSRKNEECISVLSNSAAKWWSNKLISSRRILIGIITCWWKLTVCASWQNSSFGWSWYYDSNRLSESFLTTSKKSPIVSKSSIVSRAERVQAKWRPVASILNNLFLNHLNSHFQERDHSEDMNFVEVEAIEDIRDFWTIISSRSDQLVYKQELRSLLIYEWTVLDYLLCYSLFMCVDVRKNKEERPGNEWWRSLWRERENREDSCWWSSIVERRSKR